MTDKTSLVPMERIESVILVFRGYKVILDSDLAALYGVETKRLNEQVRRNRDRFPPDFMFQLTEEEDERLRSQFATSKPGRGGRRSLPFAFTEHGAIMAASVLNSPRAIEVSVFVVRTFVKLREMLASNREMALKLAELEKKYDAQFKVVFDAIRGLMTPPKRRVGFEGEEVK